MSSYSFTFLFDYSGFKEKITPALDVLINGNSGELEKIATELVADNSEILKMMDLFRIPVNNPGVLPWLLFVISNYCSNFSIIDHSEWLGLKDVDERITLELMNTKPLGDLLISVTPEIIPTNYTVRDFNINDCPIGWLSLTEITSIKVKMQSNTEQENSHALGDLSALLNNVVDANKAIFIGYWFNYFDY